MDELDWSSRSEYGGALPDDSGFARVAFASSGLGRYGPELWNSFRWELQSWMVSQFLPGERAALIACERLRSATSDPSARACLVSQSEDEDRHVAAFSRYLETCIPAPYGTSPSLSTLLQDVLADRRWDVTVLGVQILVEGLALSAFRLAERTFHDDLLRRICLLVARDEARHVAIGLLSLRGIYSELSGFERREREELVLDAIELVNRRFFLEEIWARLGIARDEGIAFATTNPMMVAYRQAMCSRMVANLVDIGLATGKVRETLLREGLLQSHTTERGR